MNLELCDMGKIRHPQISELTTCNHHHHPNKGQNNFILPTFTPQPSILHPMPDWQKQV